MMKKYLNYTFAACLGLMLPAMFTACSDDNNDDNAKTEEQKRLEERNKAYADIVDAFINKTVVPTYERMALSASELVKDLQTYRKNQTQANLNKACEDFITSRMWWERSEAFLFGAASDFGIDPHIDSWPLDLPALQKYLATATNIEELDGDDYDIAARTKLGQELLGYHGVEYILFENGKPRNAGSIEDKYIVYAIAVAGDLRNSCWQLLASWAGKKYASKLDADLVNHIIDDVELSITVGGGELSYGENILLAGKPGSLYRSWVDALQAIVNGCNGICDEVGSSKIGSAHTGEDVSYIESPYSQRSINDFHDNITSVENVYYGGIEGNRGASMHEYMAKHNKGMDMKVVGAIEKAKTAIKNMKAPFVLNYKDASCKVAMDACKELDETLSELKNELAK